MRRLECQNAVGACACFARSAALEFRVRSKLMEAFVIAVAFDWGKETQGMVEMESI